MYMSSLSDELCRLAHKFSYRSPWHVHVIVLTNQLSRFLTKRYISVANAIWCDLYSGAGGWKLSKNTGRVKPSFMNLQISHAHLRTLSQAIGKISTKRMSFVMFSDRSICRFIFLYLSLDFFNMFFSYSLSPSPASQNTPTRFYVRKEAFKLHTFNCIASNLILLKFPPKQKHTHVSNK